MSDLESPEIEQVAENQTTESDAVRPEESLPKTEPPGTPKRFAYLMNQLGEVISSLDCLHKVMFDVGNYFFTFQGVCLAAISNSSFFNCDNADDILEALDPIQDELKDD